MGSVPLRPSTVHGLYIHHGEAEETALPSGVRPRRQESHHQVPSLSPSLPLHRDQLRHSPGGQQRHANQGEGGPEGGREGPSHAASLPSLPPSVPHLLLGQSLNQDHRGDTPPLENPAGRPGRQVPRLFVLAGHPKANRALAGGQRHQIFLPEDWQDVPGERGSARGMGLIDLVGEC